MWHSAEYETTRHWHEAERGASMGASGGSTAAELSPLTEHAKNGGYGADPFHAKFPPSERTDSINTSP